MMPKSVNDNTAMVMQRNLVGRLGVIDSKQYTCFISRPTMFRINSSFVHLSVSPELTTWPSRSTLIRDSKQEKALTAKSIAEMGVKTSNPQTQAVNSLSGGNQQKVVIGKWVTLPFSMGSTPKAARATSERPAPIRPNIPTISPS